MRIGINTRFLLSSKMEGFGWYTYEVVKRVVEAHPEFVAKSMKTLLLLLIGSFTAQPGKTNRINRPTAF